MLNSLFASTSSSFAGITRAALAALVCIPMTAAPTDPL